MSPLRFACRAAMLVATLSTLAACDDKPAPRTPRAGQTRARRGSSHDIKPAKRVGEFSMHVNKGPFYGSGCVTSDDDGALDCAGAEFVRRFHCEPLVRVDDYLGSLATDVAIGECRVATRGPGAGVVQLGCDAPLARKFVVWDQGAKGFRLIEDADDFRDRFSPVKNAEAALGFALALSRDTRPLFELAFDDEGSVASDTMTTNVVTRAQGYVVRLFEREACSCKHGDFAVDLLVTPSGEVATLSRTLVHVDPARERTCVTF